MSFMCGYCGIQIEDYAEGQDHENENEHGEVTLKTRFLIWQRDAKIQINYYFNSKGGVKKKNHLVLIKSVNYDVKRIL